MIITIILIAITVSFIVFDFMKHNYYKHKKYYVFLTLLRTISGIMLAVSVMFQFWKFSSDNQENVILQYGEHSKKFLDEILVLFMNHPELNYYYNDLTGTKKIDEFTKRNITLEKEITVLMFSNFAKTTVYIQKSANKEEVDYVESWMKHILDTYMKSETFRHHYIHEYKPKFSGPSLRKYMKDNYNL